MRTREELLKAAEIVEELCWQHWAHYGIVAMLRVMADEAGKPAPSPTICAECRYLLPPDHRARRRCAIYNHPLRPQICRDFPDPRVPARILIPGCPFRAAKERESGEVQSS